MRGLVKLSSPILSATGSYKIERPEPVEGHPSTSLGILAFATPSAGKIGNRIPFTRYQTKNRRKAVFGFRRNDTPPKIASKPIASAFFLNIRLLLGWTAVQPKSTVAE